MVKRFVSINTNAKDQILKPADLRNELLIITASEEVYKLWSKFIINYGLGETIDPDTELPFNVAADWETVSKKFTLNREFFKSMGQLEELDLKILAQHLLNETPNRALGFPKVSVQKPKKNYFHCKSAKQWVENRKRKHTIARELNNLQPSLGLVDSNKKFDVAKWAKFKQDFNVTRQTMAMLLSVPGNNFFSTYRQKKAKNKSVEDISEYAAEFFKKFLDVKGTFQLPNPILHTREFDSSEFRFGDWNGEFSWGNSRCAVAILDLRYVPGTGSTVDDTASPYFREFLDRYLEMVTDPDIFTPDVWLFITENIGRNAQAMAYASANLKDEYVTKTSNYRPSSNERFNGIAEGKVLEKHLVPLLFLVKRSSRCMSVVDSIPDTFYAPDLPLYTKAGMYCEQVLALRSTELRLEFYCRVLKMFSTPGDRFLSVLAGTKPMLAGIVSFYTPSDWYV